MSPKKYKIESYATIQMSRNYLFTFNRINPIIMSSTNFGNSVIDAVLPVFAEIYQQKVTSGKFSPPSCAEEFLAMFKGEEVLNMDNTRKELPTTPCCVKVCAMEFNKKLKDFTFQKEGAKRKTQMEMPFLPGCVDYSNTCQALQNSGSLYSPCLTRVTGGATICKRCTNAGTKYGTIQDRDSAEADTKYKRNKINYGTWCAKHGIPAEFVKSWLSENFPTIVIPEEEWIVKKKTQRRPRKSGKSASTSSDEETSSVESSVSAAPAPVVEEEVAVAPTPEPVVVEEVAVAPAPAPVVEEEVAVAPTPAPVVEEVAVAPAPEPVVEEEVAVAPAPEPVVEEVAVAPAPEPVVEEVAVAPADDETSSVESSASTSTTETSGKVPKKKMTQAEKDAKAAEKEKKAAAKAEKAAEKEKKAAAKAEKAAEKAEKAAEKEKKAAEKEKKAAAKAEKDAEKAAKKAEKDAKKAKKNAEKLEKEEKSKNQDELDDMSDDEEEDTEEYHYSHNFSAEGKHYAVGADDNALYEVDVNGENPQHVGSWDPESHEATFN